MTTHSNLAQRRHASRGNGLGRGKFLSDGQSDLPIGVLKQDRQLGEDFVANRRQLVFALRPLLA
jgi:hypothetical protein